MVRKINKLLCIIGWHHWSAEERREIKAEGQFVVAVRVSSHCLRCEKIKDVLVK
jgi:hypothetical protein